MASSNEYNHLVRFLNGDFPLSGEMQSFWMAIQGCMMVRASLHNKTTSKQPLHWFHAFALSVMTGFAGGWFGFLWMGKPSAMLYNDFNMGSCILAYVLVFHTPYDIGYRLLNTLPLALVTVTFAQLFRSVSIPRFVNTCFTEFQDKASPYYPIPIFGPILYATLLGNMGGFFLKGFEGHVQNGMPWPVQNGLCCSTFYHFYVNDTTGIVGTTLRRLLYPVAKAVGLEQDPKIFGGCVVSGFMQLMGFLQMPRFWGPTFSPFDSLAFMLLPTGAADADKKTSATTTNTTASTPSSTKKKKKKKGLSEQTSSREPTAKKQVGVVEAEEASPPSAPAPTAAASEASTQQQVVNGEIMKQEKKEEEEPTEAADTVAQSSPSNKNKKKKKKKKGSKVKEE